MDQCTFFFCTHFPEVIFSFACVGSVVSLFKICEGNRLSGSGVFGSFGGTVMFFKATSQVGGDAGIEAIVDAANDINEPVWLEWEHTFLPVYIVFVIKKGSTYFFGLGNMS